MAGRESDPRAAAFEELLERERTAVLAARFDVLERLAEEKRRQVAALGRSPPAAAVVARLKALGERNQRLLGAMARGVERARHRARALAGAVEMRTYDRDGSLRPAAAGEGGGRLSRKA